ncbi:aryl sulfotransferase [SAR202 cluster bacterium AC-409-J13_OGT_754m]|nr:aryl sulfotransferase [SAR202 cluster bacterium AC-409-J13_OGT_754m]
MNNIDQLRIRRSGTGVRAYDPKEAFNGYTLFTPMNGKGIVYLIDMNGNIVHRWKLKHPPGLYGRLLQNGNLLYCGKLPDLQPRFKDWTRWKAGSVSEVTWDSKVLWEIQHEDHHHDACKLQNGNIMLLCLTEIPDAIAQKVQGGIPDPSGDRAMYADYLIEVTQTGEEVWKWKSWEHLEPYSDRITLQDYRTEWTHGNTVVEMPNKNIMVSFRNISTVLIIDKNTGKIVWKLGAPPLAQQHDPKPLDNGNILIFDNGTHRMDHPVPFSRVIEVEPQTKNIVWSYQEVIPYSFFSPYISGAQRLPNGNTLICEGNYGRLFEITAAGTLVWEYVNPFFETPADSPDSAASNSVFRAFRYSSEELPNLNPYGGQQRLNPS